MTTRKPYRLELSNAEYDAIEFHGYRYGATEYMCRKAHQNDHETGYVIELAEHEAWELHQLWEDDDSTLACGSPALINKIQSFIDTIV